MAKTKAKPKQTLDTAQKEASKAVKWQTETLRFTAFSPFGSEPSADLCVSFTGSQPEQVTDRPAQGWRQEIGKAKDIGFVVTRIPGRIDALLTTIIAQIPPGDMSIPHIGEFGDTLIFAPLIEHWFGQQRGVIRLAFGAILDVLPISPTCLSRSNSTTAIS